MKPIFLFSIILIVGCKMQQGNKKSLSTNCSQELTLSIKKHWKYNSTMDYYLMDDTLKGSLKTELYDCILSKDTSWLLVNFGKHHNSKIAPEPFKANDKSRGSIRYSLSPECSCKNTQCSFYFFYYDSLGKITKHRFETWTLSCQE